MEKQKDDGVDDNKELKLINAVVTNTPAIARWGKIGRIFKPILPNFFQNRFTLARIEGTIPSMPLCVNLDKSFPLLKLQPVVLDMGSHHPETFTHGPVRALPAVAPFCNSIIHFYTPPAKL